MNVQIHNITKGNKAEMLEMENDIINRKESENSENLSSTTCTSTNATVSVPKTVPPTTLTDVSKPKAQVSKFNQYITTHGIFLMCCSHLYRL